MTLLIHILLIQFILRKLVLKMISEINKQDINDFNAIGLLYDNDFLKHYNILNYINNPIYKIFLYKKDKCIIGFIISTLIEKELEILAIYVKEEFRNQKIATSLIKYLISNNDINRVLLEVSEKNNAAINLYQKLGFKTICKRLNYYKDSDALVMEKV